MRKFLLKLALIPAIAMALFGLSPVLAHADCVGSDTASAIQCGTSNVSGVPSSGNPGKSLSDTVTQVINILSVLVGIVAVIMIIIGGFRYITSAGDTNKIASAKNTLLYAIIGLIVVALAEVIAQFVLKNTT